MGTTGSARRSPRSTTRVGSAGSSPRCPPSRRTRRPSGQPSSSWAGPAAMDANESPTADPFALITDPSLSVDNPDNPRLTAGMTFLGQFLDHDMTFDPTSSLARAQD